MLEKGSDIMEKIRFTVTPVVVGEDVAAVLTMQCDCPQWALKAVLQNLLQTQGVLNYYNVGCETSFISGEVVQLAKNMKIIMKSVKEKRAVN